jgi:hypothetical protein
MKKLIFFHHLKQLFSFFFKIRINNISWWVYFFIADEISTYKFINNNKIKFILDCIRKFPLIIKVMSYVVNIGMCLMDRRDNIKQLIIMWLTNQIFTDNFVKPWILIKKITILR